jgi:PAS domain S-box-containing protein
VSSENPERRGFTRVTAFVRQAFSAPVFPEDLDKTIAADMVRYGIIFGVIANLLIIPAILLSGDKTGRIVQTAGITIVTLLVNLYFLKRGYVRSAATFFLLVAWAVLLRANYTAGGVRAPGYVIQIIFIICLSFIHGRAGALLAATASSLAGIVFFALEQQHRLPLPLVSTASSRYLLVNVTNFFVVAIILSLMVNRLRTSLAEARRELVVRQEAERRLEGHQATLEATVHQRTQELAATNEDLRDEVEERRQIEESLRQERDFIGQLMETSPVGILVVDAEGRLSFANTAAALILERRREEITLLDYSSAAWRFTDHQGQPLPADELPFLRPLRGGGTVRNAPMAFESRSGQRVLLSVNATPLGEHRGRPTGSLVTIEDVTERLRLEQEVFRTQKLESVGVLAGGIAHDFNNLLTAIMGNISIAQLDVPAGSPLAEALADAEKASLQARDLTQQLLTFSRGGAPVKQKISVGDVLTGETQFTLRGTNVRPAFSIAADLWAIEADRGQLAQVFHNLGINACQAMPEGGVLRVEAANAVLDGTSDLPLPPGAYVRIVVTDGGVGIPAQNLQKIFDPFFTTKSKGTGLGLAIVHSVVRNHGGHIGVASEPGAGAAFTIHLPACPGPPAAATAAVPASAGQGRILVMDDEPVVRQVAARILAAVGYEVETVPHGEAAVVAYREARDAGRPFDAVILDLTVPGGMGGAEAVRQLAAIDPAVRAIVSSGYSRDPVMSDYRGHGFCNVIAKPYQVKDVSRILGEVLGA